MDERLPLGPLDATTLRMLLEKERAHQSELEQEVVRLRAAVARQNDVILRLERRDAERARELQTMRTLVTGLTEQNRLVRQQVAALEQENARLRGVPLAPPPDPAPEVKPAVPQREQKVRKKRAAEHNHGRHALEHATRWETHAVEECPQCKPPGARWGSSICRRLLPARSPSIG